MRAIFITQTGHAYCDTIPTKAEVYEGRDGGYYPVTPDGVFRDAKRLDDGIAIYWQGITAPDGTMGSAEEEKENVEKVVAETMLMKLSHKDIHKASQFSISMKRYIDYVIRNPLGVLLAAFIGFILISNFTGGV